MAKKRLQLLTSTDPESFPLGETSGGTSIQNVMFDKYPDGRPYATQRPGIEITTDASVEVSDNKGRGVYFWESTSATYFINDNTIYKDSYGFPIGTISNGRDPVWFGEQGDVLVILDQENNQGWTLTTGDVLTEIAGANWPTTLVGGGAVLDQTLYVMDDVGRIYGSDLGVATFTDALNVITAEREPDKGLYLGKMLDQIVAFGTKTLEFFYNAANPVGSPLSRRTDVSYRMGSIDSTSFYQSSNTIYFIASDVSGSLSFYQLEDFKMRKVSNATIDSLFDSAVIGSGNRLLIAGALTQGHEFLFVTEMDPSGASFVPLRTLVLDATMGTWSLFKTDLLDHEHFPIVTWSERLSGASRFGTGMFSNGDVIRFNSDGSITDNFVPNNYVSVGYVTSGYVTEVGESSGSGVEMLIRTQEFDNGHQNNKIQHKLTVVGGLVRNGIGGEFLEVRWTDDHYTTFAPARQVDLNIHNHKITKGGQFSRRAYELSYSGSDRVRLEAIELDFSESNYA